MQPTSVSSALARRGNITMDDDVFLLDCTCSAEKCATWLALTPDGILTVEDKDGLCVSITLPLWLDDAMRKAMSTQVQSTLQEQMATTGASDPTTDTTQSIKKTPKLQQLIEQIAAKFSLDLQTTGASLCLVLEEKEPWARLVIEDIDINRIRLACQLYIFDEWVNEPAIVFWTAAPGGWAPIECEQIQSGWQGYAAFDPQGELEDFYDPAGQAALARFADEEVFVNLMMQGWLTNSRPVERAEHWSGCQSDHVGPCYGELWHCAACGKTICYAEGTDDHPELCDACWSNQFGAQKEVNDVPF